jgi:hypothetical protein
MTITDNNTYTYFAGMCHSENVDPNFRVSDPHWFHSGSGSSFLPQFIQIRLEGAKPMRMRIQILVRLCRHKKLDFHMKNILYVGNLS